MLHAPVSGQCRQARSVLLLDWGNNPVIRQIAICAYLIRYHTVFSIVLVHSVYLLAQTLLCLPETALLLTSLQSVIPAEQGADLMKKYATPHHRLYILATHISTTPTTTDDQSLSF